MTDDELRRLIAECEAGRPLVRSHHLLELARDALRFRWLLERHSETEALFDDPGVWTHDIGWVKSVRTADLRAAIDADMEKNR